MMQRRSFANRFAARRHTALLVAIIAAFAVRPMIGDGGAATLAFSIMLIVLLLLAVYTIQVDALVGEREALVAQRKRMALVGWVLAVPALGERLLMVIAPGSRLAVAGSISWCLFFGFVTWSQFRTLLRQREITNETISMSVSVYLMLGVTWGTLYIAMFEFRPDAFNLGTATSATADLAYAQQHMFPIFVYFSLTTLATVGYGDITPLSLPARYAAVAEGITGQFYLAVLVARLVSMQISHSGSQPPGDARPLA